VQRKAASARLEVVEFLLAQERYGIATRCVREVLPLVELTPLPGVPPFVLGIANVRGQIVSVLDLKRFSTCQKRA
jgi:purine-binding chemotaxis protein CheW